MRTYVIINHNYFLLCKNYIRVELTAYIMCFTIWASAKWFPNLAFFSSPNPRMRVPGTSHSHSKLVLSLAFVSAFPNVYIDFLYHHLLDKMLIRRGLSGETWLGGMISFYLLVHVLNVCWRLSGVFFIPFNTVCQWHACF
jgi:hypothetical protein